MKRFIPLYLFAVLLFNSCGSSKKSSRSSGPVTETMAGREGVALPSAADTARSLMELPQTQDGGFVLAPGFYETEFKTYCLQPGTPDPRPGDAYLQGPVTGKRKEIVETVLLHSRERTEIPQRHIQLLLWSVVSGSDFDKLSYEVKSDAMKLLTPAQVFQLRGGVPGLLRNISRNSGLVGGDLQKLFEIGSASYETYENIAVLREPSRVTRKGVQFDQWYKQKESYYIRYFPVSYQKVRIQVYVPQDLLDNTNKHNGEYIVFDPTGQQAIPAYTNAQRLGIGAPVKDILRVIIQVNKRPQVPVKTPKKKNPSNPKNPNPEPSTLNSQL
ncbi:MAG: hypothetical protein HYZ15_10745 [Sphingobacteriales bacterium]|nr:hypothetical protein [Sphingobacteriales bacterium]